MWLSIVLERIVVLKQVQEAMTPALVFSWLQAESKEVHKFKKPNFKFQIITHQNPMTKSNKDEE
jgi:hypothetical protein